MKLRVLNIIASLFVAACTITSCLDTEVIEVEYNTNASITGFSITDSIVTIIGTDTTAILGADYPFIIDQNEGRIYNADSLPVGTDISKVVVDITADTYGIYIQAEEDSLWESTDSLDFRRPVYFKVVSEMGTPGRTYKAEINVHQQDPDTLIWRKRTTGFDTNIKAQKAVYLNNNIYVFAEQESQVAMTSLDAYQGKTWTSLESLDIPVKADYSSATTWKGQIYILAENELYVSDNGLNWQKVETTQTFSRLLVGVSTGSNQKLIGVDTENHYISSQDGITWNRYASLPADFPNKQIFTVCYPLSTNTDINRIVLTGEKEENPEASTVVWTQIDSENEWTDLVLEDNTLLRPQIENAMLIYYDNQLLTFGGVSKSNGTIVPFNEFIASKDNGITWENATEKMAFPVEFKDLYEQANGNYSCIVDDKQYIWMMWSQTGEVWRGRINKFGFKKQ